MTVDMLQLLKPFYLYQELSIHAIDTRYAYKAGYDIQLF